MRYPPTKRARKSQIFSEPFRTALDLSSINWFPKQTAVRVGALCLWALFLGTAANAQLQVQRLYTAVNTSQRPTFLLQGTDGNFYGTMANAGYVFKLTPAGNITILSPVLGLNPELAPGDDGNFYGTANAPTFGNTNGYIFKITPVGQVTVAFAFDGTNGAHPIGMRKGIDGCFYGIMGESNANRIIFPAKTNHATIFQFTTNGNVTKLYSVTNGPDFSGLPVQGTDGYLYGATFSDSGLMLPPFSPYRIHFYRLSTNGNFQTIYTRTNASASAGELIFGPDGLLYGTIGSEVQPYAPGPNYGSIFRMSTNGIYSTLFSFNSTNGTDPEARLLANSDGYFYGSTFGGGISNRGTLFRISVHGELTTLVDFTGGNGSNPTAPLVQGTDGNLYGVTESAVVTNIGTIYRLVQPTTISNIGMSNGTATLTWNSFPDGIYRVEYKSALANLSWTPLTQRVTATDQTITIVDTQATDPQRSYRVVLLP